MTEDEALFGAGGCLDCGVCSECQECVKACPADSIKLDAKDAFHEIEVGGVVISTGHTLFAADLKPEYGFGRYPNVITGMQMDRLLAPTRPFNTILRPGDGKVPDRIAYVSCTGSRDETTGNPLCSKFCCMYSIKQNQLIMGSLPLADVTMHYMDMRAAGKRYDEFYEQAKDMGATYIKGRVAKVTEKENGDLVLRYEDIENGGAIVEAEYDLVVLAVGIQPNREVEKLFGGEPLGLDEYYYVAEPNGEIEPGQTDIPGVFVAGTAAGAKDIVDSILHAGAAVAQVAAHLTQAETRPRWCRYDRRVRPTRDCRERARGRRRPSRRIGVYICHCGGNISDYVDVAAVRDALKDEPGVVIAETTMFACSDGTQHDMIDDIRSQGLDGLVVASCSPKLHQITFRGVAKRADMNPYAYTQVNIREQDSWVHGDDPVGATEKAIGLVRAGIAKSRNSTDLEPLVVETTSATMVVGAGIAGLRAAIGLADVGLHVYLVEREATLGGWVGTFGPMFPNDQDGRTQIAHLVDEVSRRPAITVFTSAELVGKSGSFGNYVAEVRVGAGTTETIRATVGSIVIATGFDTYEPEAGEFGYGIDGVVTLPEFKAMVDAAHGPLTHAGRPVRTIAYIYCVGSRQPAGGNEYCSKYCCAASCHASLEVGALDPSIHQYHLNRDVRTYGKYELLYTRAREQGAVFMRFPDDTPPTVERTDTGQLIVTTIDSLTQSEELDHPRRPRGPGHGHGPAGERGPDRPAQAAGRRRRLLQRDPPQAATGRDRRRRRDDRRHLPGTEDRLRVRGLRAGRRDAERRHPQEGRRRARSARRDRPRVGLHRLRRVPRGLSVRRHRADDVRRSRRRAHHPQRLQGLRRLRPDVPGGRHRPPRLHRRPDARDDRQPGGGGSLDE